MKKHRVMVPTIAVMVAMLGACGSDGGGGASFSEQLQAECRTIARGLRSIDPPTQLADFEQAASDASKVYGDGLTKLKALDAPKDQADDFADLQANYQDQIDLFDQIATAAKNDDAATVTTKITSLDKATEANAELADSLDAKPCAFAAVFTANPAAAPTTTAAAPTTAAPTTAAPTTAAPTTAAPTTAAPTTAAPTTAAPTTAAPTTAAPTTAAAAGNKVLIPFAVRLTPKGDYSFVDTDESIVTAVREALSAGPLYTAQSGTIGAVDLLDSGGDTVIRAFIFVTDAATLTPGTLEEAENLVSGGQPLTPATLGGISGKTFPDPTGLTLFVAAEDDTLLVVAGATEADLDQGIRALVESLP